MVHLQPPGVYAKDKTRASASVTLWLRQGMPLADSQVAAIAHMVAASVGYGMRPEDVKITDSDFHLLYPSADGNDPTSSLAHVQKAQAIERALEEKAESQLRRAFGDNKASVRVSVELDTRYREMTSEKVEDKNKVPVKSSSTTERVAGAGATGGDPSLTGGKAGKNDATGFVTEKQEAGLGST